MWPHLHALVLGGALQLAGRDLVTRLQAVDAVQARDVENDRARDDRREVLGAAREPVAAAEVLLLVPSVPERPEVPEVVEGVDVRPAVDVHGHGIS